jgi:hypothetical protein
VCRRPWPGAGIPSVDRDVVWAVKSWRGRSGPEERRELSGDGDGRDVGGFAALLEAVVDPVESVLCLSGDLQDVVWLAVVAAEQRLADPGVAGVVPGRLD